jgi:predicted DCC family thiol-disulfide oxidoreductase YuxK
MKQLTVYYDELCVLCAKEIHHYQKQVGSENILFVDITSETFDAKAEGVDPFLVHQIMHSKTNDGKLHTKIDAFIQIWKVLPKYHWLVTLAENNFVKNMMDAGYFLFAEIRPYLPKKKKNQDCSQSPYCEIHADKNLKTEF